MLELVAAHIQRATVRNIFILISNFLKR